MEPTCRKQCLRTSRTQSRFSHFGKITTQSKFAPKNSFQSIAKGVFSSDTYIVVSTPRETHLFRVDEGEERLWYMDPITIGGLITSQPTLALTNVMRRIPGMSGASAYGDSPFVVQVTPVGISVLEIDKELGTTTSIGSLVLHETDLWKEKKVVAASINPTQVVIALDGGVIASFALNEQGHLQVKQ